MTDRDHSEIEATRTVTYRFWVSSVLAAAGIGAELLGAFNYLIASLPFVSVLLLSYLDGWWPHPDTVDYRIDARRAIEGDEVELIISGTTKRSLPWLEATIQLDDGLAATPETRRLDYFKLPNGHHAFETRTSFLVPNWGVRGPRSVTVTSQDRFGMTSWQTALAVTTRVQVHPPSAALQQLIDLERLREATGEHGARSKGHGTELAEVRAARPGDPAASIHPRLSARRGKLMVLERHPDLSGDVVLLIDATHDIGNAEDSSLRWAVQAALSVNSRHQRGMDRVGIIDWGGTIRWLAPGLGRRAAHQVVDALLHIQTTRRTSQITSSSQTIGSLPLDKLPPRCLILALSPGLTEPFNRDLQRARRHGHQVAVVQPTLPEHDGQTVASRIGRVLLEQRRETLLNSGVQVLRWDPSQPLGRLLAAASTGGRRR